MKVTGTGHGHSHGHGHGHGHGDGSDEVEEVITHLFFYYLTLS